LSGAIAETPLGKVFETPARWMGRAVDIELLCGMGFQPMRMGKMLMPH